MKLSNVLYSSAFPYMTRRAAMAALSSGFFLNVQLRRKISCNMVCFMFSLAVRLYDYTHPLKRMLTVCAGDPSFRAFRGDSSAVLS